MKTTSIHTLFFSPTGTSRKIAAAVAQGLAGSGASTGAEEARDHGTAARTHIAGEDAAAQATGKNLGTAIPGDKNPGTTSADGTVPVPRTADGKVPAAGTLPVTAIDLTHPAGNPAPLPAGTVAVFAVPVYGGHVAPTALERLRDIRGEGTPAVVLAVYGNRAFGTAVTELAAFVAQRGFIPVAAGAFVGEHSYSTPATPIAQGRPDAQDMAAAAAFGAQVREKLTRTEMPCGGNYGDVNVPEAPPAPATYKSGGMNRSKSGGKIERPHIPEGIAPIDAAKLREPRTPLLSQLRFIRFVLGYRRRQKRNPVALLPRGDAARCTQCGRCAALCPTQAIARGDELHTDPARCIRCCACVKGCAFGARTFETPFAAALARNFTRRKPPVTML